MRDQTDLDNLSRKKSKNKKLDLRQWEKERKFFHLSLRGDVADDLDENYLMRCNSEK